MTRRCGSIVTEAITDQQVPQRAAPAAHAVMNRRSRRQCWSTIRSIAFHQAPEAVMVVVTGRASLEVRPHSRNCLIGIRTGKLQLDVPIELLEALLAAELGPVRA
jgi:hypothetical protein